MIGVGRPLRDGGFDRDLLAEGFELADEVALAGLGVGVPGEVLGADVVVVTAVANRKAGSPGRSTARNSPRSPMSSSS